MKSIEKFYNNTEDLKPHENIRCFLEKNIEVGNAVELGCGAGRDTIALIKKGWNVLAIDREDTEERIAKSLNEEELKRFKFERTNFEDLNIKENNLVVANFSLPFCNKSCFEKVWNKVKNSILPNGFFIGNFFGVNDEWRELKPNMVFLTREGAEKLFDEFEIIRFKEIEKQGTTGLGKVKHWHIFDVVARKK